MPAEHELTRSDIRTAAGAGHDGFRGAFLPAQGEVQLRQRPRREQALAQPRFAQRRGGWAAGGSQVLAGPSQLCQTVLQKEHQPLDPVGRYRFHRKDRNNPTKYFATTVEYELVHPLG